MGAGITIRPIAFMLYPFGQAFHSGSATTLARPAKCALQKQPFHINQGKNIKQKQSFDILGSPYKECIFLNSPFLS